MTNTAPPKRRLSKIRPIQANPKEMDAWRAFEALIAATESTQGNVAPMVLAELDRLCAKAHPLALRLKERLSILEDRPRHQTESPKPPPAPRRLKHVQWTHGKPEGA